MIYCFILILSVISFISPFLIITSELAAYAYSRKTIQQILARFRSTCKSVLTPLRPFLQQSLSHPAGQTGIKCEQYTELT